MVCGLWPSNRPREKGWASQRKSETRSSSRDTQQVSSHLYVMYKCNHRYICNHAGDKQVRTGHSSLLLILCHSNKDHHFWGKVNQATLWLEFIRIVWADENWHNAFNFCSAPCEWIISSISKLNLNFVFQIQKIIKRTHIRSFTDIQDCNVAVTIYINTLWKECLLPS